MQRLVIAQHRGELVEMAVTKAFGLYRLYGRDDILAVRPGLTMSLVHVTELLRQ